MKVCTYCDLTVAEDIESCLSCGSTEFNHKCGNCGTIYSGTVCPSCGVLCGYTPKACFHCEEKTDKRFCPHCGADLINMMMPDYKSIKNSEVIKPDVPQIRENIKPHRTGRFPLRIIIIFIVLILVGFRIKDLRQPTSNFRTDLSDMEVLMHPNHFDYYNEAKD